MITLYDFENFIHTNLVYEQKLISIIDKEGRQIYIDNLKELYEYPLCAIKLEQMEKYSKNIFDYCHSLSKTYGHVGPITCHVFRSFKNSKSFGLHTDPDIVIIYCVHGSKTIIVDGVKHILTPNMSLIIPANIQHEAINEEESLTLSFGLEKFYTEKIKI